MTSTVRSIIHCLLLGVLTFDATASALEVRPATDTCLFGGRTNTVEIVARNQSANPLVTEISVRIFQLGSGIAAPLGSARLWKRLHLPPGQTVLEQLTVELPCVRGETHFALQFSEEEREVVSQVILTAYPTNLLESQIASERPIGVIDTGNSLKPLLAAARLTITDLEQNPVEDFAGELIIAVSTDSKLHRRIARALRPSQSAILIHSSPDLRGRQGTSDGRPFGFGLVKIFATPAGARLIITPREIAARLHDSPLAQLTLIDLMRTATSTNLLSLEKDL